MLGPKILGPKRFWVQKNFETSRILGSKIFIIQKIFESQRIWVSKTFDYLEILVPEKFRSREILGQKIFWFLYTAYYFQTPINTSVYCFNS